MPPPDQFPHQLVAECNERIGRTWPGPALTANQLAVITEAVRAALAAAVAGVRAADTARALQARRQIALRCANCRKPFAGYARGPLDGPRYCDVRCRSAASNARRRAKADPPAETDPPPDHTP